MLLYALTIFTGAFLLFQVQPLMGKFILPWFGGSPGVWTTCLLFFQTLLLGGYAYAHWISTRLKLRQQTTVHLVLLVISLAWLPIMPGTGWKPLAEHEPISRILLLLTACLGLPYFILSATGPLLQQWFGISHAGRSPYRLYSLSNAGSLLALLSYPFVFEPWLSRNAQGLGWSAGLVIFVGLCGACAWRVRKLAATMPHQSTAGETANPLATRAALVDRIMWLALPAAASVLLVATTNKLCQDVAVVPFLWVLPLAVYLLSFILCFDHPRWYSRRLFAALLAAGCGAVCYLLPAGSSVVLVMQVVIYTGALFAACMVCHGELYRLKPAPRDLTQFYLCISAGGALGGLFVAVVAPLFFSAYYELQIGLAFVAYLVGVLSLIYRSRSLASGVAIGVLGLAFLIPAIAAETAHGFLAWVSSYVFEAGSFYRLYWKQITAVLILLVFSLREGWRIGHGAWHQRMPLLPLIMSLFVGVFFVIQATNASNSVITASRNFYGSLTLYQYNEDDPGNHYYLLAHGGTTHGLQLSDPAKARWASTYYGPTSGVGRALDALPGKRRIGLVGLGTGTLSVYGRADDTFHFYEINPAIVELAHTRFSYLSSTPARVEIALGDARLVMEDELARGEAQQFDLLALDAFSSDAIPVHLLTREAFELYVRHLAPAGVIAVHISNRYLDLRPVVEALALHHGLHFVTIEDDPENDHWWLYPSTWMLLTKNRAFLESKAIRYAAQESPDENAPRTLWTDDHASLLDVLK